MNKKSIIKIFLSIIALAVAAWAIIPIFTDNEVSESAPEQATTITTPLPLKDSNDEPTDDNELKSEQVVMQERVGSFEGRNTYSASGSVMLIEDASGVSYVRFEDNFMSDNGPDLIVYIGTADDRGTALGSLKGNIGSQNYELPSELDLSDVDTVRVFCRAFNLDFAITTL